MATDSWRRRLRDRRWLLALIALMMVLCQSTGGAAAAAEPAARQQPPTAEQLWEQALTAEKQQQWPEAQRLFSAFQRQFPDAPQAEEALWRAAQAARRQALSASEPDWETVANLFRFYLAEYPKSTRGDVAYFEIGKAYYRMRFFPEALTYFKLFGGRYPDSPLRPEVRYWQARTLMAMDRPAAAARLFRQVAGGRDPSLRLKAVIGLGEASLRQGKFRQAVRVLEKAIKDFPERQYQHPELYLYLGQAYLRLGKEEIGRGHLFHYLNLAPDPSRRLEVLFEIAESFHRQKDDLTAQKLYARIVAEGKPDQRPVVLARFRQAQYRDAPHRKRAPWQKPPDLSDPAGDQPYLAVLDAYRNDPIAQDARYGLFLRYRARGDFDSALAIGKSFLRSDPPGPAPGEKIDTGGEVMLFLVEGLVKRHRYQEVYDLYQNDYPHLDAFRNGRLRYLVGQAFEAMGLYDQAAVVYYRALAYPLSEQDKLDLYYRRARLYLLLPDYPAAERLLRYLRKVYRGRNQALAEVLYLSGRLREAEKHDDQALSFYEQAVAVVATPGQGGRYAEATLRMMVRGRQWTRMLSLLARCAEQKWLPPAQLQEWYVRAGDGLRGDSRVEAAANAYLAALGATMPAKTVWAQRGALFLGDLLLAEGNLDQARTRYQAAGQGPEPLLARLATERLNQLTIDRMRRGLRTLLENG